MVPYSAGCYSDVRDASPCTREMAEEGVGAQPRLKVFNGRGWLINAEINALFGLLQVPCDLRRQHTVTPAPCVNHGFMLHSHRLAKHNVLKFNLQLNLHIIRCVWLQTSISGCIYFSSIVIHQMYELDYFWHVCYLFPLQGYFAYSLKKWRDHCHIHLKQPVK